ncbi:iron transporter [Ferrimonas aestuarii]|uniref:Iron transporter n=1 Tax=Ferrimonas aestuarii TaxID=2569539 RepID=A0A4U1BRS9_9GAMM|nr:iron transporter [Ferrimonas aestuarii]TKB56012.1 iron transporter [Ferrimonas aestuarii]
MSAVSTPKPPKQNGSPWTVVRRTLAATVGGYIATAAVSAAIALALPLHKADSTLLMMMLSFLIWATLGIYVFSVRSERRAWTVLLSVTLLSVIGLWLKGN